MSAKVVNKKNRLILHDPQKTNLPIDCKVDFRSVSYNRLVSSSVVSLRKWA